MRKNTFTHKCGHAVTVEVQTLDALVLEQRFTESTVCKNCFFSDSNQDALKKSIKLSLPDLQGSEAQVSWANTIRMNFYEKIFNLLVEDYKGYLPDKIGIQDTEIVTDVSWLFSWLFFQNTSAKFWIEHRDYSEFGMMTLALLNSIGLFTSDNDSPRLFLRGNEKWTQSLGSKAGELGYVSRPWQIAQKDLEDVAKSLSRSVQGLKKSAKAASTAKTLQSAVDVILGFAAYWEKLRERAREIENENKRLRAILGLQEVDGVLEPSEILKSTLAKFKKQVEAEQESGNADEPEKQMKDFLDSVVEDEVFNFSLRNDYENRGRLPEIVARGYLKMIKPDARRVLHLIWNNDDSDKDSYSIVAHASNQECSYCKPLGDATGNQDAKAGKDEYFFMLKDAQSE